MSDISVTVDLDEIEDGITADSRGRITLGSEYADETVTVAVLSRDDDGEE